jgi:hypothetical protein
MNPGDLVRLVASKGSSHVAVAPLVYDDETLSFEDLRYVSAGEIAVVVDRYNHPVADTQSASKYSIMIDNQLGWVYESEIDLIVTDA